MENNDSYNETKEAANNLVVFNDAAERDVELCQDFL